MNVGTIQTKLYFAQIVANTIFHPETYLPFLSITPIGNGLFAGIVIKPRGPIGNAGFYHKIKQINKQNRKILFAY